jgi:hypothetical protein
LLTEDEKSRWMNEVLAFEHPARTGCSTGEIVHRVKPRKLLKRLAPHPPSPRGRSFAATPSAPGSVLPSGSGAALQNCPPDCRIQQPPQLARRDPYRAVPSRRTGSQTLPTCGRLGRRPLAPYRSFLPSTGRGASPATSAALRAPSPGSPRASFRRRGADRCVVENHVGFSSASQEQARS